MAGNVAPFLLWGSGVTQRCFRHPPVGSGQGKTLVMMLFFPSRQHFSFRLSRYLSFPLGIFTLAWVAFPRASLMYFFECGHPSSLEWAPSPT